MNGNGTSHNNHISEAAIRKHLNQFREWLPEEPTVCKGLELATLNYENLNLAESQEVIKELQKAYIAQHTKSTKREETGLIDSDTGFLSKNAFNEAIDRIINEHKAGRFDRPVTVGVIDLNYLKVFNNQSHGGCGDKAISYMLGYLTDKLHKEFGKDAIVARFGGDEIGIAIKDKTPDDARIAVRKILQGMANDSINGDAHGKNQCIGTKERNSDKNPNGNGDAHGKNQCIGTKERNSDKNPNGNGEVDATSPIQVSAASGFALLDFAKKGGKRKAEGIRHEAFTAAGDEETDNKWAAKEYAASVPNGYPPCDHRVDAEKVIGKILDANFNGRFFQDSKDALQFAETSNSESKTIRQIAEEHGRKPTIVKNSAFAARYEAMKSKSGSLSF